MRPASITIRRSRCAHVTLKGPTMTRLRTIHDLSLRCASAAMIARSNHPRGPHTTLDSDKHAIAHTDRLQAKHNGFWQKPSRQCLALGAVGSKRRSAGGLSFAKPPNRCRSSLKMPRVDSTGFITCGDCSRLWPRLICRTTALRSSAETMPDRAEVLRANESDERVHEGQGGDTPERSRSGRIAARKTLHGSQ